MISKVTLGVKISVSTDYQPGFSSDQANKYLFSYQVTIDNFNDFGVQLLKRHWKITDGFGMVRIVDGSGVIGIQPIIDSFENYSYQSACDFQTSVGTMEGYYVIRNLESGKLFKVEIPNLVMVTNQKLN
jgi:ApaG protein